MSMLAGLLLLMQSLSTLVGALNEESPQKRSEAYLKLLREKPSDAPALVENQIAGWRLEAQELGIHLINSYPPDISVPCLRRLSTSKVVLVNVSAAAQLLRLGYPEAEAGLAKTLKKADIPAQEWPRLIGRMYGLRQSALSQVLVERIRAQAGDEELRALLDHFVVVSDPRARPAVAALLALEGLDDERRLSLCAFLVSQGDDSRMTELETLLARVGGPGLGRNYRLFEHAPRLSPGVLAVVAKLAETEPLGLALNAVRLLGQFGTAKEMPALERLVESKDTLLSKNALEALQKRTGNVPRESLIRVLAGADEQRVLAAADALRRADDLSGFERVLAIAGGSTPARAEALRVLGRFRRMEGVAVMLQGLEAPEEGVRVAADEALRMLLPNLFPYRRFEFQTVGYDPRGAAQARAQAVQRYRSFFEQAQRK
jgi:HEAT repeat protein